MPTKENETTDEAKIKRGGIYPLLKSIDERLELAVKLIGYTGILIISPLVFVFTYIGIDIYSALGIRQLSEYQKSVVAELEAKGLTPDADGALVAIRQGDADIDKFFLIGSQPDALAAAAAISERLSAVAPPPSTSEIFATFIRSDERLSQSIRQPIEVYNATIDHLRANPQSASEDFCERLAPLLKDGSFGFPVSGIQSCADVVAGGLQVAALSELQDALRNWSVLLGDAPVQTVDQELKLSLSSSSSASLDRVVDFTNEAFFSSPEGSVFKFSTPFAVISPPVYWEQTGAWKIALLEQGLPKLRGGYLPVALVDAYGPWALGLQGCEAMFWPGQEQSCEAQFTASLVDGKMQVLKVEKMSLKKDLTFLVSVQFAQEMEAAQ